MGGAECGVDAVPDEGFHGLFLSLSFFLFFFFPMWVFKNVFVGSDASVVFQSLLILMLLPSGIDESAQY